jgi:hypothetical protein
MKGWPRLVGIACFAGLATTSPAPHRPPDLAGKWQICLTLDGSVRDPVCGDAEIRPRETRPMRIDRHDFIVTHKIPLDSLVGVHLSQHGSIAATNYSTFRVWLGTPEGVVDVSDGDQVVGDLTRAGERYLGAWYRTCYANCPGSGDIEFRRRSQ